MAQDEEAITRIFTADARYLEHPFDPNRIYEGRAGIRDYWVRQIQGKQRDIRFTQVSEALLLDSEKQTALAKWSATFMNLQRDKKTYAPVSFVQVAMLTFDDHGLISKLEEYWTARGKHGKGDGEPLAAANAAPGSGQSPAAALEPELGPPVREGDSVVTLTATVAEEDSSPRLLGFASKQFDTALRSAAEAKRALKRRQLTLNAAAVTSRGSERLSAGDVLTLTYYPEVAAAERMRWQAALAVLYEDSQVAVVEKPSGLPAASLLPHCEVTAELALPAYLNISGTSDVLPAPRLTYGLESGTPGLLLAAKTAGALSALQSAAASGKLRRRYRAIAVGLIKGSSGDTGEFMLNGEVGGVARGARARLVALTRSEHGWLSTVDVWLGANADEKHTVRELLLQHDAPLLGHRGVGFGKGNWLACVEVRFPLEPRGTFDELARISAAADGEGAAQWGRFVVPEPEKFEGLRGKEARRWEQMVNNPSGH